MGIEPMISSLPMRCFTTKLRRLAGPRRYSVRCFLSYPAAGRPSAACSVPMRPFHARALPIFRSGNADGCVASARHFPNWIR